MHAQYVQITHYDIIILTCGELFGKGYALYPIAVATPHAARYDVIGTLATEVLFIRTHSPSLSAL